MIAIARALVPVNLTGPDCILSSGSVEGCTMSRPSAVTACVVLAVVIASGMVARAISAGPLRVLDLDGRFVDPLPPPPGLGATVLLFIPPDCPLPNPHAPELH